KVPARAGCRSRCDLGPVALRRTVHRQERTLRTFIAPCAPEPASVRSARRPGAQRVRMQSATWGGFRHEQAVGAAATGDRSRSEGGFMGREPAIAALGKVTE